MEAYISATTEIETVGETGYDVALGKEYHVNPVEFKADDGSLANYRVKKRQ